MLGLNPWTYKGGGGQGVDATPHKVFLQLFQEEFLSAPVIFRSCTHVHRHIMANFSEIDCSGYTLCRQNHQVVKPSLKKNTF